MLRGGVIMDVVTAEQAKIAEDAGAVAVMALERVPADIRRDGGVARMSDPALIEGIKAAVTIPVMAKARIGHFAEAQVLESLGVDYVDESEVLTPADEAHHIDKWAFTVPFVCGATNLGEALRRISEGAAMIRSKGEAGHRQHQGGRAPPALDHSATSARSPRPIRPSCYGWAKQLQAPVGAGPGDRRDRPAAGAAVLRRRASPRRPTPPWSCSSAPRPCFVGSGIFKSADPARFARAIVEATTHFRDAADRGQGQPRSRRGHARRGVEHGRDPACRSGAGSGRRQRYTRASWEGSRQVPAIDGAARVGVLALQGDVREHVRVLAELGAAPGRGAHARPTWPASTPWSCPGGESTTMSLLLESSGLLAPAAGAAGRRACRRSAPAPA